MTGTWVATHSIESVQGGPMSFLYGDLRVLVAVVDGLPRAVEDACLHRRAALSNGTCRDGIVTCPSHWWRYDLRDGRLQGADDLRLPTYPCRVSQGVIEVHLPDPTQAPSLREALLAHAREGRPHDA